MNSAVEASVAPRGRWLGPAILAAVLYVVFGVGFGALAGQAATHRMVEAWRLAAWAASAIVFGAQILYEVSRRRASSPSTALHASGAAAAGAFGLAVAAVVHSGWGSLGRLKLALILWPVITAVPAFVVALAAAAILIRLRKD